MENSNTTRSRPKQGAQFLDSEFARCERLSAIEGWLLTAGHRAVGFVRRQDEAGDHLAWDEVRADAEVFEGSLDLRAPEFVGGDLKTGEDGGTWQGKLFI
jgi:hypothetical protein